MLCTERLPSKPCQEDIGKELSHIVSSSRLACFLEKETVLC